MIIDISRTQKYKSSKSSGIPFGNIYLRCLKNLSKRNNITSQSLNLNASNGQRLKTFHINDSNCCTRETMQSFCTKVQLIHEIS